MAESIYRKEFEQAMYAAGLKKICKYCGEPEYAEDGSLVIHPNTCTYTYFPEEDWLWVKSLNC